MSYISALYRRSDDEVIVWERNNGVRDVKKYPAPYHFYIEDEKGKYKSIFGKKLRKIEFDSNEEFQNTKRKLSRTPLYESDINPDIKILSQFYYNVTPPKLNVTLLDIEVDYNPLIGFSSTKNPYAPINAVALHHIHTDRSIVIAVPPPKWDKSTFDESLRELSEIVFVRNEKELLNILLDEIEDSDILSGWNCIPETQNVWLRDKIVPFRQIGSQLYDSTVLRKSDIMDKQLTTITTALGHTFECSPEHRFPVLLVPNEKYTNLQNKIVQRVDISVNQMVSLMNDGYSIFTESCVRNNTNTCNPLFTNEQLYLAGLIYTDGTLKDKNNVIDTGYVVYQSDSEVLNNIPLVTTKLVGPHKRCYSRVIEFSLLGKEVHNLIYEDTKKRLNVEKLSTLSKKQFYYFLAGLLDGDGYVSSNSVELCNYNNDTSALAELCLWNGIITSIRPNVVRFLNLSVLDIPTLKLKRRTTICSTYHPILKRDSNQKAKQTTFKVIGQSLYTRICDINISDLKVPMMDIETDTHYFYSKGTKTHNSDFFDMPYIAKRIEKTLGKSQLRRLSFEGADMPRYREVEVFKQQQIACDLSGRVHLDYMNLFKKYEVAERPSYKLESIAEEVLPHLPKLEYEGSLADLYKKDFNHFIKYNIRDTEILKGFEKKLGYISLANVMCHSSTSQFKDVFGTLKLSDFAVVNYCHYELDVKVPDWDGDKPDGKIQGAYVLLPQIGLHEWIGSIDIGGLYPASIRSINISPETLIGQFSDKVNDWERIFNNTDDDLTLEYDTGEVETRTAVEWKKYLLNKKWAVSGFGTVFDQNTPGVFPAILSSWINKRKEYQKLKAKYYADAEACTDPDEKSKLEELCAYYDRLQYVMKIKSNSFYGAITNFYFRFFSLNGGESVTGTGRIVLKHQIKKTAEILDGEYNIEPPFDEDSFNKMGRTFPSESIIYSDTDSVVGSTVHITNQGDQTIETLFNMYSSDNCNNFTCKPQNLEVLTYDPINQNPYMGEVEYIYRHLVSKEKWLIQSEHGDSVEITGDHSVMVEREGKLIEVKPENIICGDLLITCVEV